MHFKEYLELTEEVELFDQIFALDEANLTAPIKFAGGAATNLASQALRGAGNIAGGLTRTALGGVRAGAGVLQAAGGGLSPGWENIRKGAYTAASGLGQTLKGTAQTAASPVSAVLRGAQAASEPLSPRSFSDDRNWFQKTFGLDRWEQEKEQEKKSVRSPKEKEWIRLIKVYKSIPKDNQIERSKILDKLRELDPIKYFQTKRKGQDMKADTKTSRFLTDLGKQQEVA